MSLASLGLDFASFLNSPLRFLYGVSGEAWDAAMQALHAHEDDEHIQKPWIVTLVDFTRPARETRLWSFNLLLQIPLASSPCAHGKNSGGAGEPATKFSNDSGSKQSCLGAFATYHKAHDSHLGHVSGKALKLHGLDTGVNSKAMSRGIVCHGADYVTKKGAGRSHGCFATIPEINNALMPLIAGGTFLYAWGGADKA